MTLLEGSGLFGRAGMGSTPLPLLGLGQDGKAEIRGAGCFRREQLLSALALHGKASQKKRWGDGEQNPSQETSPAKRGRESKELHVFLGKRSVIRRGGIEYTPTTPPPGGTQSALRKVRSCSAAVWCCTSWPWRGAGGQRTLLGLSLHGVPVLCRPEKAFTFPP